MDGIVLSTRALECKLEEKTLCPISAEKGGWWSIHVQGVLSIAKSLHDTFKAPPISWGRDSCCVLLCVVAAIC